MTQPIKQSMMEAYFHVAETIAAEPSATGSRRYFHRTKKVVFSVMAEKLGKDGLLPGERPFVRRRK